METAIKTNRTPTFLAIGQLAATLVLTGFVAKVALNDEPTAVASPVKVAVQPTQFEYMVDSIPDLEWSTKAQKLGEEGWELVFARRASGDGGNYMYECIFQRQSRVPNI